MTEPVKRSRCLKEYLCICVRDNLSVEHVLRIELIDVNVRGMCVFKQTLLMWHQMQSYDAD